MSGLRELWSRKMGAVVCWLHSADELTVEVLAQLSYDAYVVDLQHGMARPQEAVSQLRALQAMKDSTDSTALVRISELSSKEVGMYLDAGFAGVICPMINNRAQAEALVAATRYAPEGERSFGPTRAIFKQGKTLEGYTKEMKDPRTRPVILAMIETKQGLENLTEILKTEIDGVFIGPMDLSCALDEPCQGTKGPKTQRAISRIAALAQRNGKVVGIYVSDRSSTEYYLSKGFHFVVNAHDKVALMAGAKAAMPRQMQRVKTTHVGSLPRPEWLVPILRGEQPAPANYEERLMEATVEIMQRQLDVGLDEINDGELGRRDYVTAARQRLSGFGGQGQAAAARDLVEMKDYSSKLEGRKGLLTLTEKTEVTVASCTAAVSYTTEGLEDLQKEMRRVKTAAERLGVPLSRVFFSSPSPGTLANFFGNDFYESHEEYIEALAGAMATEYRAIQDAGFKLQVDCPDLAMGRHTRFAEKSLAEFQEVARFHVQAMNGALEGLDAGRIRMHVCWGNYPGPHHHDVALADIAEIIMGAIPKFISVEACNPGHAHEHEVWKNVKVPQDKVLMPGVLDTTTSHIENPRLVAQRLESYTEHVGMARVMACTDCGFSTAAGALNLNADIAYCKMASMAKGAASLMDKSKKVVMCREMPELDLALLDAFLPQHARTTSLLMGSIVTNPHDRPLLPCYGYNLTYNRMDRGQGNALHRHAAAEIFVPLDRPFEFAYGSQGEHAVTLDEGSIIAIPAGVTHSYKNVGPGSGRILTILPGKPQITWNPEVVARAQQAGAKCTEQGTLIREGSDLCKHQLMEQAAISEVQVSGDEVSDYVRRQQEGQKLRIDGEHGWLEVDWLRLKRGQQVEMDRKVETVGVVLQGFVCCGEKLGPLDLVQQPSFFSASSDSLVLLIRSSLPHDLDYVF